MKKKNKGFTLVELLVSMGVFAIVMVQIGNLIVNSTRLYQRGTLEVDLQSEAQHALQIMEEFMIDATVSVNSVSGMTLNLTTLAEESTTVSGTSLTTIYTHDRYLDEDCVYKFFVAKTDDDVTGQLYLYSDAGGSITVEAVSNYIASVSVDLAHYEDDYCTISLVMSNGQSSFQTVEGKDVYFRNLIGSGGAGSSGEQVSGNNLIDVLRYHTYAVSSIYDPNNEYVMSLENAGGENNYVLTYNGSQYSVKLNATQNKDWAKSYSDKIICTNKNDPTDTFEINLHTDSVKIGLGDEGASTGVFLAYINASQENILTDSFCEINGVSVQKGDYKSVKIEFTPGNGNYQMADWALYDNNNLPNNTSCFCCKGNDMPASPSNTAYKIDRLFFATCGVDNDANVNALVCYERQLSRSKGTDNFNDYSKEVDLHAVITFTYPDNTVMKITVYFVPMGYSSNDSMFIWNDKEAWFNDKIK